MSRGSVLDVSFRPGPPDPMGPLIPTPTVSSSLGLAASAKTRSGHGTTRGCTPRPPPRYVTRHRATGRAGVRPLARRASGSTPLAARHAREHGFDDVRAEGESGRDVAEHPLLFGGEPVGERDDEGLLERRRPTVDVEPLDERRDVTFGTARAHL